MTHAALSLLQQRASINTFDSSYSLSDLQIQELVALATTAPTAFNFQNWRFIAVRTLEAKLRLQQMAWGQQKVADAAVTFIICGQLPQHTSLGTRLQPSVDAGILSLEMVEGWVGAAKILYGDNARTRRDEAIRSAIFGASTLIHAAQASGLASGPMIGFDADAIAKGFELAADEIPVLLLTVGKTGDTNWPQKPRRPLAEVLTFA